MSGLVGVYGGTFNPVHLGHLRAAEEVTEALGLARLLFVPSAHPPHKSPGDDPIAPAALRLDWLRLAIGDHPLFEVSEIETRRPGPSYTVDTLRALRESLAPREPVFVIGHDAFVEMGSWRAPREILRLAHVAVTSRPPVGAGALGDWIPAELRADLEISADGRSARNRSSGTWLRVLEVTALDISASDIRLRLREGRSTRYLLPDPVRLAVEASGVYARRAGSRSAPADSNGGSAGSPDARSPGSGSGAGAAGTDEPAGGRRGRTGANRH